MPQESLLFEVALNTVHDYLADQGIEIVSEKTLMTALPLVIECVETIKGKNISGVQKKDLALRVVRFVVVESPIEEGRKVMLLNLIDGGTIETTVDIIIAASKGKFELNRRNKVRLFHCVKKCVSTVMGISSSVPVRGPEPVHVRGPVPGPGPRPVSGLERTLSRKVSKTVMV
jgi:hypothetical protein